MSKKTSTMQNCPQGSFSYTIKSGDTLFKLAQKYNTTVEAITKINPGINPNNLRIGQIICIPGTPAPTPPPTPSCPNGFLHTIRPGDTLFGLSQQFGISVEAIIRANPGINPNNLQIGQKICIPGAVAPMPPCLNGFYYTIKAGDTLFKLSQQFGVSVEEIIMANPGIDPNRLQIGQTICIPRSVTPTPPVPPCPNGFYYSIRPGDTYFSISNQFGISIDALIRANPGVDPDRLQIGQIICVPSF